MEKKKRSKEHIDLVSQSSKGNKSKDAVRKEKKIERMF